MGTSGMTNVIGTSTINMKNDGGWCWLTVWATHGSLLYAPTFHVSHPPTHGELMMGEVSKRARIEYRPVAAFAGEDTYTIVDVMTNMERVVRVTVSR